MQFKQGPRSGLAEFSLVKFSRRGGVTLTANHSTQAISFAAKVYIDAHLHYSLRPAGAYKIS
jgi:hypothetical protein